MNEHAKLDPDWLSQELVEAASDYAASTPFDIGDELLSEDDARRLRDKLAARYAAWTGRDLRADMRAE